MAAPPGAGAPPTMATSGRRPCRPTAPRSRSCSRRAPTSTAPRSASPTLATGAVRALTGTPRMQDRAPAWSPDGSALAYVSERSGTWALHAVGARRERRAAADRGRRRLRRAGLAPRRRRDPRDARDPQPHAASPSSTRPRAQCASSPPAALWSSPHWTAGGGVIATYEDHATPPELRAATRGPGAAVRTLLAPAPLAVRRAPHVRARGRHVQLARRARDPRLPVPPASASPRAARGGDRLSARRPDRRLRRRLGRPRAVLHRQGLRLAGAQLPRLDRLRARVRARATTASGASRTSGTASPPPTTCARSTGSTASGSRSSAPATAPTWRCSRSPTTPSTASAAPWRSTATATS